MRLARKWVEVAAVAGLTLLSGSAAAGTSAKPTPSPCKAGTVCLSPATGSDQQQISMRAPTCGSSGGQIGTVTFSDPANRETYTAHAIFIGGKPPNCLWKISVPYQFCIRATQAKQGTNPLVHELVVHFGRGKVGHFKLVCKLADLDMVLTAVPGKVIADGQSTSTVKLAVTYTIHHAGGAKEIVNVAGLVVRFQTDLGDFNPADGMATTNGAGIATVTISSADAGIANLSALPMIKIPGPALPPPVQVHFVPKITGISEQFVSDESTTFFDVATFPKDQSQLDFTWSIQYPAGDPCGELDVGTDTGHSPMNGYFHEGCEPPPGYEASVKVTVTATDKAGDSATCQFFARGFEGQGFIVPPGC